MCFMWNIPSDTQAGSGDGENTLIIDDEEDDDIYLAGEGSGRLQEDKDMVEGKSMLPVFNWIWHIWYWDWDDLETCNPT